MYYLRDGLAKQNKKGLGAVLAVLFAIACIGGSFGGGNMVQINQATSQLIAVTGEASLFMGTVGCLCHHGRRCRFDHFGWHQALPR